MPKTYLNGGVADDGKRSCSAGRCWIQAIAKMEGVRGRYTCGILLDRRVGGFFFSVFFVLFSTLFFIIFLKSFLSRLGPFLGPMLGLCWELFRAFFALKLRSYLKVVFSSIFHRSWTPLEPQKVSSRAGENQKINILHFSS